MQYFLEFGDYLRCWTVAVTELQHFPKLDNPSQYDEATFI